jgi:hypothetical protein
MPPTNLKYAVSWNDFNRVPSRPANEHEDAKIKIQFPYGYDTLREKNSAKVTAVNMTISPANNECWVVDTEATDELLKHEQGHYDITAIGARELYDKISGLSAPNEDKLKDKIKDEEKKVRAKIAEVNKRYDSQTDHHNKKDVQDSWDKQIATELQKPDGKLRNLPQ